MAANNYFILDVHIVPRASRTEIRGWHGAAVKIRLQAPPVDGKANRALLEFLGQALNLPAGRLSLVSGETSRQKRVRVEGLDGPTIRQRLGLPPP